MQNKASLERSETKLIHGYKMQNAYILHIALRSSFSRNPYTVNNLLDVWECDFVDI